MSIEQEKVVEESSINWKKLFFMSLFFGIFGVDRFLAGKKGSGVLKLLTGGGFYIWYFIDLFTIANGKFTDSLGRRVSNTAKQRYVSLSFVVLILFSFLMILIYPQTVQQQQAQEQEVVQEVKQEVALKQVDIDMIEQAKKEEKERLGSFTDTRDKKTYKTVKIDKQTWMAENLAYNAPESRCYEDNITYCNKYGRLYNWTTAKKACPKGWHLPSQAEWAALDNFVSAGTKEFTGKKLKASSGWQKSGNGEDAFGFSALPGGYWDYSGGGTKQGYFHIGYHGYWWSATEYDASKAWTSIMSSDAIFMRVNSAISSWNKNNLFSVRCIKN
jgi:uncharacterized protein (TIGR02145 family)